MLAQLAVNSNYPISRHPNQQPNEVINVQNADPPEIGDRGSSISKYSPMEISTSNVDLTVQDAERQPNETENYMSSSNNLYQATD